MISSEIITCAKVLWDYHKMRHTLKHADCILVLGSHDVRVGEYGAKLYLDGYAPLLIMSGGLGNLTSHIWDEPEADKFAKLAMAMGVPRSHILIENRSTNTGENITFTRRLLDEKKIEMKSFIVVQKPYMERRAYATFMKKWPGREILIASPPLSFEEYPAGDISLEDVINIMVGDLQRIMIYPALGYQIAQDVPEDVRNAYDFLVRSGYTRHMVKSH